MISKKLTRSLKSPLAQKLIASLSLFGIIVAIILTLINFNSEYNREMSHLTQQLEIIEQHELAAIIESVWSTNKKETRLQLQSIVGALYVEYAEIIDVDGKTWLTSGSQISDDIDKRLFPLIHTEAGKKYNLGSLVVHSSIDHVWESVSRNSIGLLVSNIILMLFIAAFVFALFYYFITRHITKIVDYVNELIPGVDAPDLSLSHTSENKNDELDKLVMSINVLKQSSHTFLTQLRESEERYRAIADYTYDWESWHLPNGDVFWINPAVERVTGYSVKECKLMDGYPLPIIAEDERQTASKLLSGMIEHRTVGNDETFRIIKKDGSYGWIAMSWQPIFNSSGDYSGIRSSVRDITERKLAEISLIASEERLRRTQKMDALGKLTGGIAHDYNNMLGVILGYSELIEEVTREQPKLTDYINQIKHAGERGAKLTKKLLTFSRQQSSENKIVNLNTLLEGSKLMLEKTLTVRISLVYELEKSCWPINLDESDLEDAILNMSINAMHSIEGSGQLTFETRNEAIKEIDAQHLDIPAGDYVLLSITDTGCGMDNKTKENIFDPFFSTKGELGTGLGLSQVYGFAQRSKGNVKIYSELGHGSRFTLYFPRYYESDIEEKQLKEAEETNLSGNQIILVVDDEPALATLTSHTLTRQGYHVFIANSGKEALLILENEPVDVLVSDVIMPEMDGYELATIVQEKYPNIKIQLASGFNDDRHVDNINDSLHENLLHKPYHSKKLLLRIRELLNGSAD